MAGWPEEYTLKTNDLLSQDCLTIVCLTISGRLDVQLLEEKHVELVRHWPVLGGQLVMSTSPYKLTTGSSADFKSREINAPLKEVAPMDFSLTEKELKGIKPLVRPYRTGKGVLSVTDLAFDSIATLNLKVGSLFAIRVTLLNDATIIAFKFSHFFVDGEGSYDIIEQYSNLIQGKPLPKAMLPPNIDTPMSSLIRGSDTVQVNPPEEGGKEYLRNLWQVGFGPWISLVGKSLYAEYAGRLGFGEAGVEKHVYLPPTLLSDLQNSCQAEVDRMPNLEAGKIRISKNDVLTAWCFQRIYAHLRESITIDIGYIANYSAMVDRRKEDEKYFTSQYLTMAIPFGTVEEMKKKSLAELALIVREKVILARQPSIVRDNLEFIESAQGQKVLPIGPDTDLEGMPLVSSWTKFPFEKMAFNGALVDKSGSGKVLFNNARVLLPLNIYLKPKLLYFNDTNGGVWVQFMQLPSHWKGFADIQEYDRD